MSKVKTIGLIYFLNKQNFDKKTFAINISKRNLQFITKFDNGRTEH